MKSNALKKTTRKQKDLSIDFKVFLKIFGKESNEGWVQEHRFHSVRRWRFDFAWPSRMVAVECDGIIWKACGGRHNTDADRDKINTAISLGWSVLRFSGNQIKSDPIGCIDLLRATLIGKGKCELCKSEGKL